MVSRADCLKVLSFKITNELIICSVAGQTTDWATLKDRDGNLYEVYLSGTTPVALGLALALPHRRIVALDSDGGMLMGLTVLPVIAQQNPSNLIIIVFDNESYDCLNQIPTFTAGVTDLAAMARGAGIRNTSLIKQLSEFKKAIDEAFQANGATFIVVKTEAGRLSGTGLALDASRNKHRFISYIEKTEKIQIIKPSKKTTVPIDKG